MYTILSPVITVNTHASYPQKLANLQVGHMVFQQSLGITDVFFGSYEDEGNHTLKEENTSDLNEKLQYFIEANKHSKKKNLIKCYCVILCSCDFKSLKNTWGRVWGVLMLHLQAYLLSGQLFVVVSFDSNTHYTRLVYNFLNDFATFSNNFA